ILPQGTQGAAGTARTNAVAAGAEHAGAAGIVGGAADLEAAGVAAADQRLAGGAVDAQCTVGLRGDRDTGDAGELLDQTVALVEQVVGLGVAGLADAGVERGDLLDQRIGAADGVGDLRVDLRALLVELLAEG